MNENQNHYRGKTPPQNIHRGQPRQTLVNNGHYYGDKNRMNTKASRASKNNGFVGRKTNRPIKSGDKRRFPKLLFALLIILLLAAGAYYGLQKIRENKVAAEIAPYENVYGAEIYINDVPIAGLTPSQALEAVSAKMYERTQAWQLDLTYNGWKFYTLSYNTLGISFSESTLYPYLNEAWALTHTGDVYMRKQAILNRKNNQYRVYTTKQEFNDSNLTDILVQIANSIYKEPMDAMLIQFRPDDANPFLIREEQVGMSLDVESAKQKILEMAASGVGGKFEIEPTTIQPKITKVQVEQKVALRAEASTAISKYSTDNRNNNIRISLAKINGTILEPGETLSFNKVVGPRTIKAGFFEADEMVKGDLVTGVGGGVCQSSSTLYQAALKAGMSITDRDIHSAPVLYTEKGFDATVFLSRDRNIDFKFKNTSSSRIYITAHVIKGSSKNSLICRIRIYGESLGDGVIYKLKSVTDQVLKTDEIIYVPDKEQECVVYKDETKLKRKAEDGYIVSTYLRKYQHGNLIEETLISRDEYKPKPTEYWQGTTYR
ncbi:MAG: VanW family protein [Christensenellales bacterium]